jgi:hypothetical protein
MLPFIARLDSTLGDARCALLMVAGVGALSLRSVGRSTYPYRSDEGTDY